MGFVFGYIDATSGSMVLQAVVGGGLAALYAGRRFGAQAWRLAMSKLGRGQVSAERKSEVLDK